MTTVQLVCAAALSIVVFVMLGNLVVDLYARGAIRAALDEGARAGAPVGSGVPECEERARGVLAGLLSGDIARLRLECRELDERIAASAAAVLRSWLPGIVPDWSFELEGSATKEHNP
jgi:hypothetical protein